MRSLETSNSCVLATAMVMPLISVCIYAAEKRTPSPENRRVSQPVSMNCIVEVFGAKHDASCDEKTLTPRCFYFYGNPINCSDSFTVSCVQTKLRT